MITSWKQDFKCGVSELRQVWQVLVGTVQDTGPMGIRMGLPLPAGMLALGPTLATQSGPVFFAGTQDFFLRAYDGRTGKEVWKARLPWAARVGQ